MTPAAHASSELEVYRLIGTEPTLKKADVAILDVTYDLCRFSEI